MRILGLDPSLSSTGWAIIEDVKVIKCGTIETTAKDGIHIDRICLISDALLCLLIKNKNIACVAIEEPFVGLNKKTAIILAKVHGALIATAQHASSATLKTSYAPRFVKQIITGSGNASKEQVMKMVTLIAGYTGNSEDESDAIAVALTCVREITLQKRGGADVK